MVDCIDFESRLAQAMVTCQALPEFPEGLTLESAYAMLPKVAELASDCGVAGIKAGLTNPDLQGLFGLEHALLGLLLESGRSLEGAELPYREKVSIECEIGIVVDASGRPISFGPALELVQVDFSKPEDMTAPNLVACSLGAVGFISGPQQAWRDDFSDCAITLSRNDEVVLQSSILESLGGPKSALKWVREEAAKRDLPLRDQSLIMTGTCGAAVAAEPGHYVADYGDLGRVEFSVV